MMTESYPLLKVMLLGDGNVGKTSLARQFVESKFDESRILTIGVDFQTKVIALPEATYKLSIWDVAGQERFQSVREVFYKGCSAAALVYDVSSRDSAYHLTQWYKELKSFAPSSGVLCIGNKIDLPGGEFEKLGLEFSQYLKIPHIRTSAKTGEGVEELFVALTKRAIGAARS